LSVNTLVKPSQHLTLKWFSNDRSVGGILEVWHTVNHLREYCSEMGHRTWFSRNLELMIRDQVSDDIYISESSHDHTVFVFRDLEKFTIAKLMYDSDDDGENLRRLVNDFVKADIMPDHSP